MSDAPQTASPPVEETSDNRADDFYTPRQFFARVYTRVLLILLIYVLSIGPMFWKWHHSMNFRTDPFIAQLYYPLLMLCEVCPPLKSWVNWYIDLWTM